MKSCFDVTIYSFKAVNSSILSNFLERFPLLYVPDRNNSGAGGGFRGKEIITYKRDTKNEYGNMLYGFRVFIYGKVQLWHVVLFIVTVV